MIDLLCFAKVHIRRHPYVQHIKNNAQHLASTIKEKVSLLYVATSDEYV